MGRKILFLIINLLLAVVSGELLAQQEQNIIPISPEAAALTKMVNYSVNKNTGIPDINIPFYTVQVGDLSLPVNLTYQGGGFKINEHATREGLGWRLSANIQITRAINGLDDLDPQSGYIGNTLMKAYNKSQPYVQSYFNQGDPQWWHKIKYDLAAGVKDGEPDKFNYSLIGKSGSFYFMKNASGSSYTIVPVPYDNIKITYDNGRFIIVDTDGTTYYFGEQGGGDLYDMQSKGKEITGSITLGTCMNCKVTAWKCMRIESSINTNFIDFSYEAQSIVRYRFYNDFIEYYDNENPCGIADEGYYHSDEYPLNIYTSYENIIQNTPFYRISSPKYMVHYGNGQPIFHVPAFDEQTNMIDKTYPVQNPVPVSAHDISGLALSEISFRGGKVRFNGVDQLSSIEIMDDKNNVIKSASFYQSFALPLYTEEAKHYNGGVFQGTAYLDSLHIKNSGNVYERYAFLYNDKFCYGNHLKGHDAWGYPNESTVEIAYANSTYGNILSIQSKLIIQGRYYRALDGGCIIHNENIPIHLGGGDWAEAPDENSVKKGSLRRMIYPSGGFTDFDWESNKYEESFYNSSGYYQKLPRLGGGLRIRSISYFDGSELTPKSQEYYRYGDMEDGNGILLSRPRQGLQTDTYHYEAVDYDQQISYLQAPGGIQSCDNSWCLSVKTTENKKTIRPASVLDYTFSNGAPIYYTKVSVYKQDLGQLSGKSVYEYYPPNQFMPPQTMHEENRIPGTPLSFLGTDGLMGAQKSESQYTYDPIEGYRLIHRKSFNYTTYLKNDWIRVAYAFFNVIYQIVEGNYIGQNQDELYNGNIFGGPSNMFNYGEYCIAVGKLLLSEEMEQTIDGGIELTQTTNYFYDNPSYIQPSRIITTSSAGDTETKTIKYPYDFTGVYAQMVSQNIIDIPITVTMSSASAGEISKKATDYRYIQEGWGFFAPVSIRSSYGGKPLTTEVTFDRYNEYGNILQRTQKNGVPVSFLWGYNNLYPVAKLEGVTYNQIPSNFLSNIQINTPSSDAALRSLLDDLRNAIGNNAQISTYTYKRLVGITSETSLNHYTTYYEYDPIGRLVTKRNNDQHIVGQYDYQMTGPSIMSTSEWYVNYPMMESYNINCENDNYAIYNYVVSGGKHIAYSQDAAILQAKDDLGYNNSPPANSPCNTTSTFATASVKVTSFYYSSYNIYPREVIVDFIQDGSIVASCTVPSNTSESQPPLKEKELYLPPGQYKVSIRTSAETRYNDAFLSYYFLRIEDGISTSIRSGDVINLLDNMHYQFRSNYNMLN